MGATEVDGRATWFLGVLIGVVAGAVPELAMWLIPKDLWLARSGVFQSLVLLGVALVYLLGNFIIQRTLPVQGWVSLIVIESVASIAVPLLLISLPIGESAKWLGAATLMGTWFVLLGGPWVTWWLTNMVRRGK